MFNKQTEIYYNFQQFDLSKFSNSNNYTLWCKQEKHGNGKEKIWMCAATFFNFALNLDYAKQK